MRDRSLSIGTPPLCFLFKKAIQSLRVRLHVDFGSAEGICDAAFAGTAEAVTLSEAHGSCLLVLSGVASGSDARFGAPV